MVNYSHRTVVAASRRPAPAIYRLACERLGLPPTECVFPDDLWPNFAADRREGMTALLYSDQSGTSKQVNELFGL